MKATIDELSEGLITDAAVAASILSHMRRHHRGGRPRSRKKRCPCGASTFKRAKARGFDCCKKAKAEEKA